MQIMAQNQISWNIEEIGCQNKDLITMMTGVTAFMLTFVNLKQMSFVARLVMAVSVFVIIWVVFEASIKIYILNSMRMAHQKFIQAVPLNQTMDHHFGHDTTMPLRNNMTANLASNYLAR